MLTKKSTLAAYELGVQQALINAGLVKKGGVEIPESVLAPLLFGGGGALACAAASPLARDVSPGEGALVGALTGLGGYAGPKLLAPTS